MHRIALAVTSLLLLFSSPVFGLSRETNAALDRLTGAMYKEHLGEDVSGDEKHKERMRQQGQLLFTAMVSRDPDEILKDLDTIAAGFDSQGIKDAIAKVRPMLKQEQIDRARTRLEEVQKLLRLAQIVASDSGKPEDLDETLAELKNVKVAYDEHIDRKATDEVIQQVADARKAMVQWRERLAARNSGDYDLEQQLVKEMLADGGQSFELVPRATLLKMKRMENVPPGYFESQMQLITTLDDMEEPVAKMSAARDPKSGYGLNREGVFNCLVLIDHLNRDFIAGGAVSPETIPWQNERWVAEPNAKVTELSGMLLKKILPRHIGAPSDTVVKPEESVLEFLDRVTEEAKEREDFQLAYRARRERQRMAPGGPSSGVDELGMNAWEVARKREAAGQLSLAVISYQQSLNSGSDVVPARAIGARLKAVQSEHPQEYAEGMEHFMELQMPRAIDSDAAPANAEPKKD